jgi:hypothetical protein
MQSGKESTSCLLFIEKRWRVPELTALCALRAGGSCYLFGELAASSRCETSSSEGKDDGEDESSRAPRSRVPPPPVGPVSPEQGLAPAKTVMGAGGTRI